jgi:hypothetical protein
MVPCLRTQIYVLLAAWFRLEESVRFGSSFAIKQLSRGSNLSRGQDFIGAFWHSENAQGPRRTPHRLRDTLAVDMLSRGASPYHVAKILADMIETVDWHYAPFTKGFRERVRGLIYNGEGLEKTDCTKIAQSRPSQQENPMIRKDLAADEPISRIVRTGLQTNKLSGVKFVKSMWRLSSR